jgi:hypothetical protein
MQLKNKEVVSAFFESYLYIRKDSWKLDISNPGKSHLKKIDADKLKFCGEVFNEIESADTVDAWIKLLHKLAAREAVELKEVNASWLRPIDLVGLFYDAPLLLETTRAARSYIIAQLKNDEEFTANKAAIIAKLDLLVDGEKALANAKKKPDANALVEKNKLLRELHDLDVVPLPVAMPAAGAVLTSDQNICTKYFEKFTKARDSRSKSEVSFADFEKNVLSKLKKLDEKIVNSAKSSLISKPAAANTAVPNAKPVEKSIDKSAVDVKASAKASPAVLAAPKSSWAIFSWTAPTPAVKPASSVTPAPAVTPVTVLPPVTPIVIEEIKNEAASVKPLVAAVDLTKTPPNSPSPLLLNSFVGGGAKMVKVMPRRRGRSTRMTRFQEKQQEAEQQDAVMTLTQN